MTELGNPAVRRAPLVLSFASVVERPRMRVKALLPEKKRHTKYRQQIHKQHAEQGSASNHIQLNKAPSDPVYAAYRARLYAVVRKNTIRCYAASFSKRYSWCKPPRMGTEETM